MSEIRDVIRQRLIQFGLPRTLDQATMNSLASSIEQSIDHLGFTSVRRLPETGRTPAVSQQLDPPRITPESGGPVWQRLTNDGRSCASVVVRSDGTIDFYVSSLHTAEDALWLAQATISAHDYVTRKADQ